MLARRTEAGSHAAAGRDEELEIEEMLPPRFFNRWLYFLPEQFLPDFSHGVSYGIVRNHREKKKGDSNPQAPNRPTSIRPMKDANKASCYS